MKPFKSLSFASNWLLRIALALFVYINYFDSALSFSFNSVHYLFSLTFVVFAVLLIVGGFTKAHNLTVLSGLIIAICAIVIAAISGNTVNSLLGLAPLIAIGFYFFAKGNNA